MGPGRHATAFESTSSCHNRIFTLTSHRQQNAWCTHSRGELVDSTSFVEQYRRELRRIGLDEASSPYGGMASNSDEAVAQFLAHLRALPVGATWRDVHPDIPEHWDLDDEETWTEPYRPLGSFDYPTLPCGPAVLIRMPRGSTEADLSRLSAEAADEGWDVTALDMCRLKTPSGRTNSPIWCLMSRPPRRSTTRSPTGSRLVPQ